METQDLEHFSFLLINIGTYIQQIYLVEERGEREREEGDRGEETSWSTESSSNWDTATTTRRGDITIRQLCTHEGETWIKIC
jgi:hypothetical protein